MSESTIVDVEVYNDLVRDVHRGQVVAFVGAGVSQAVGVPGWDAVLQELAKAFARQRGHSADDLVELSKRHPYRFAQTCRSRLGEFKRVVVNATRIPEPEPDLSLHRQLLRIPFHCTVSTNWDDLFERAALAEFGVPLSPVIDDTELRACDWGRKPILVKPHGTLGQGIVATESDIFAFEEKHPGIAAFLQSLFFTRPLFFIGYGMNDPDLLRYYWRCIRHLRDMGGTESATPYILAVGESEVTAESWRAIGMRVIRCAPRLRGDQQARIQALTRFVDGFHWDAYWGVIPRDLRLRKIVDFLSHANIVSEPLRVRAGIGPLGLPDRGSTPAGTASDAERRDQSELKQPFKDAVEKADPVKFILSTDLESMQQRSAHGERAAERLRSLVRYFTDETHASKVQVVDRRGPYEIQQYIIGDRLMAESRKLSSARDDYHTARTVGAGQELDDAVRLFDSCFESLTLSNLEWLWTDPSSVGRNHIFGILTANRQKAMREIKGAKAIGDRLASSSEEMKDIGKVIRKVHSELGKREWERKELEAFLSTVDANVLFAILTDEVIYGAIRQHLVRLWTEEAELLSADEPRQLLIQVLHGGEMPVLGRLQKHIYHNLLPVVPHGYHCQEVDAKRPDHLWNLHLDAYALTGDARRLILRRRLTTGEHLDLGRWDRTISGHLRLGSTWRKELDEEIGHHFGEAAAARYQIVTKDDFQEKCARRHRSHRQETDELIIVGLQQPPPRIHPRTWVDKRVVAEPVLTMPFLILMPSKRLPVEALRDEHSHATGWAELQWKDVEAVLAGEVIRKTYLPVGEAQPRETEIGEGHITSEALSLLRDLREFLGECLQ